MWVNQILFVISNRQDVAAFNQAADWRVAAQAPIASGVDRQGLGRSRDSQARPLRLLTMRIVTPTPRKLALLMSLAGLGLSLSEARSGQERSVRSAGPRDAVGRGGSAVRARATPGRRRRSDGRRFQPGRSTSRSRCRARQRHCPRKTGQPSRWRWCSWPSRPPPNRCWRFPTSRRRHDGSRARTSSVITKTGRRQAKRAPRRRRPTRRRPPSP